MRRFLIGLAGGAALGYIAIRTREALAVLRDPPPPAEPDPQAYGALRRSLMLAGMARSLATLAFAAYAIGPALEPAGGAGEPRKRRIALVALGLAGSALLEVPVDYVEGIALERRFGLSKQTDAAWLADYAKGSAVTIAIGLPLIELLAVTVARAPRLWPLLATAGSFPLLVLANVVAPTFIAPLFNAFEPIEGEFAQEIRALAGRYGAGDATLLRVDMSRQTEKANAYVTGLFDTKRIVIGDTLLDRFEPRETLFVVAHELGHYVAGDVWRAVALGVAASAFVFFGGRRLADQADKPLGSTAGLARLIFAVSLLGTLAGPLLSAFSRSRERAADDFALSATHDGEGGAAAFRRLRERNLAEDEQPKWMELLFSSHPSLGSRIARLETAASDRSSS
jgi:Zn-dependent protease with chaperone function